MRIDGSNSGPGPTMPFHLARAYGVERPAPVQKPMAPSASASTRADTDRVEAASTNITRLVAGGVPGGVDFASGRPSGGMAIYRHPADRNAAATGVSLGHVIDTAG